MIFKCPAILHEHMAVIRKCVDIHLLLVGRGQQNPLSLAARLPEHIRRMTNP
jgi:hypothetical protein